MPTLNFELQPSKAYLRFSLAVFFVTGCLLVLLPIPLGEQILLLLFSVAYTWFVIQRFVYFRGSRAIIALTHVKADEWQIATRQGTSLAHLHGESTLWPWISILRFRVPGRRFLQTCIVCQDSLTQDAYRQLQVVLKMY